MLEWLVEQKGIEPHIPVFDKSERNDGTFSRSDFAYDPAADQYTCPAGRQLRQFNRTYKTQRSGVTKDGQRIYRARKADCDICPLKDRCCPGQPNRKIIRSIHEASRDVAQNIAKTEAYVQSRRKRKKVEMLFAHLKRILGMTKLRLRGPNGARDEFHLAATAQNLRKLAKLVSVPA
jgi:adenine-specific DNA glycosylase